MSSQWYLFTDDEAGPFSAEALCRLIREGNVLNSDMVRRSDSKSWQRVDQVAGLLHLSRNKSAASVKNFRHQGSAARWKFSFPEFFSPRVWMGLAGLGILSFLGQVWWAWMRSPDPFPVEPDQLTINVPSRVEQLRAPEPFTPTLPGLKRGEPRPVPGLERVAWAKSPTLSHDLLRIVYVSYSGETTLDDLFFSQRASVDVPFELPRRLTAVNSPAREAHPTLSPNGRELIFTRLGTPHQLWHSRWDDAARDFTPATLLEISGEEVRGRHLDNPQFLTDQTIKLAAGDEQFTQRQQLLATRPHAAAPFAVTRPIPLANPWPRYTFSPRGERAYFPSETGLHLTAFQPQKQQFVLPDTLLNTEQAGLHLARFDDTVWVAPREDLIVYCSPGRKGAKEEDHKLWMVKP